MDYDPRKAEEFLDDKLLTVKEAANVLRVARSTLYHLMELGELPSVHVGGSLRFRASDLRAYVAKGGTSVRHVKLPSSRRTKRAKRR